MPKDEGWMTNHQVSRGLFPLNDSRLNKAILECDKGIDGMCVISPLIFMSY